MKNIEEISTAIAALKKIKFIDYECSIMAGGNYEESVLIGTKDAFVFLALQILEIVQASDDKNNTNIDFDEDEIEKELFEYTNEIKKCFNEFADVWPICAYVAKDKARIMKLIKYFSEG